DLGRSLIADMIVRRLLDVPFVTARIAHDDSGVRPALLGSNKRVDGMGVWSVLRSPRPVVQVTTGDIVRLFPELRYRRSGRLCGGPGDRGNEQDARRHHTRQHTGPDAVKAHDSLPALGRERNVGDMSSDSAEPQRITRPENDAPSLRSVGRVQT